MTSKRPLVDTFGRVVRDLRISVTDRCGFRCTYCMPAEGLQWLPRDQLLTFEEVTTMFHEFGHAVHGMLSNVEYPLLSGTNVTYTLAYHNLGTLAAQAVQVVDTLPAGLSFVSASTGGVFDAATGTITFTVGTLAANDGMAGGPDEGSATVTARVTATGSTVTNSAVISTSTAESDSSNNSSSVTNAVIAAGQKSGDNSLTRQCGHLRENALSYRNKTYVAFGLGSTISEATAKGNFNLLCAAVVTMALFVVRPMRLSISAAENKTAVGQPAE